MKFIIHRTTKPGRQWWFTIVSPNGRTLVTSEMYARRGGCLNAIDALARGKLGAAPIEDASARGRRG